MLLKGSLLGLMLLLLTACGGETEKAKDSSLVSMTPTTDASCLFGGTNINIGLDANGNGQLDSNEITDTTLLCNAQGAPDTSEFELSGKGQIEGRLDLGTQPITALSKQSSSASTQKSLAVNKVQPFVVTSQAGSLWLTPNDISSAIQADQAAQQQAKNSTGSDTQLPPPIVTPIEIPVAADGTYSIDVPAGTDYSLNYVSADGSQGIKIEDVNVSPNQKTDVSIASQDFEATGSVSFTVQSLANNSIVEGAVITLLNDTTNTLTDAAGGASFEGLPEGSYSLLVESEGFISQTFPAQVRSGELVNLGVLPLNNEKGSASGSVTAGTTLLTSLENIVVYARDQRGSVYSTLTNSSGTFVFNALPVATGYSFIAQANDFSADKIDNITISASANTEVGAVQLKPASAYVGSISGFAKFSDKLAVLNAHAGLLVAVEGTDKEAVTSRDGAFILNNLLPGRYTLNFTDSNYQTTTLENIRVVATSTTSLDPVQLSLKTGQVSGIVSLDGQLNSAGVLVEVLGSPHTTYTDNSGRWFLNLPTGNYGNGIRYSANLFESKTVDETISVIQNGKYQAGAQVLGQTGKQLNLDLAASGGSCSSLQVALTGISGEATGYNGQFTIENGSLEEDLTFGDYILSASCIDRGFETVVRSITLEAGSGLIITLEPISLRVSFVTINQGAAYTNDLNVTLDIGAVGASEMQIIQGASDTGWIALTDTHNLALEAGDGNKTVLVHLRDDQQQPLSDVAASINLDTTITVASFTATGASTKNDILHVRLDLSGETDATATVTIPGLINGLVLFDNGLNGDVSANDGIYERDLEITTPNELTATVTANIIDRAGNTLSQDAATNVVLSTNPSISAVSVSSNVASGEMTIRFSTDEPATSAINYGADANTLNTNLSVEAVLRQNHTVTLTGLPANQLTHFQLVATDTAANEGTFNGQGKLAPAPIEGLNAAAGSAEVGLVWGASTHNELAGYNVYRSADGGSSFNVLNTGGVVVERYLVDSSAANETAYQYYITVVDVDGNESIASGGVEVTPSLSLAGPTEMDGGVIAVDTIWLSSRSPYSITDNMLIREGSNLLIMAGSEVQLVGSGRHVLVKGSMQAYGEADNLVIFDSDVVNITHENQPSIIFSDQNMIVSKFDYAKINFMKLYVENSNNSLSANLEVNHSELLIHARLGSQGATDFAIKSVSNSLILFDQCNHYYAYAPVIETINNSELSMMNGSVCIKEDSPYVGAENAPNLFHGVALRANVLVNTNIDDIVVKVDEILTGGYLESTLVISASLQLNIKNISAVNTHVWSPGGIRISKSKFDLTSTVRGGELYIANNYWGTTDLSLIGEMTGYIPDPEKDTHLYPIITSSNIETADWDGDGIPDIRDHDNDNDGFSDLQEDWASDPAYGSIYNPLDASSHPSGAIDTDMDGIADITDTDDDNDNLSDADEAVYGTDPLLADSDNDGSLDGDEISRKYDPLDGTNFPYIGSINGIAIDGSNLNADGVVYFAGEAVTLNSVIVSPGVKLMVDRDTDLVFNNSSLNATQNNPIFMRSSGTGTGGVTFHDSQITFANINLDIRFDLESSSSINRSDLLLKGYNGIKGTIQNSFVHIEQSLLTSANSKFDHLYLVTNTDIPLYGEINASRQVGSGSLRMGAGSIIRTSVVDSVYEYSDAGSISNSIIFKFSPTRGEYIINSSDISILNSSASFFNDSYISNLAGTSFYDGLGAPSDIIGDGLSETGFTLDATTYTVDGIKNPRSTPNFPNGESDLWDPNGVGALWDKNDPNTFPDPLGL